MALVKGPSLMQNMAIDQEEVVTTACCPKGEKKRQCAFIIIIPLFFSHTNRKEGKEDKGDKEEDADTCDGPCFPSCTKNERLLKCMWGITIPFFALLVVSLIGLITAALVVVPISKAFSDAPNWLVGF